VILAQPLNIFASGYYRKRLYELNCNFYKCSTPIIIHITELPPTTPHEVQISVWDSKSGWICPIADAEIDTRNYMYLKCKEKPHYYYRYDECSEHGINRGNPIKTVHTPSDQVLITKLFKKVENKPTEKEKQPHPQKFTCVLCKQECSGYGNNPIPLAKSGPCCNTCNTKVITRRLQETEDEL